VFFFEKKNQKTFDRCDPRQPQRARKVTKVFLLLFFQKKKAFLPC